MQIGTMTIEKQKKHIENEQGIIDNIRTRGEISDYDMMYIADLERKIKQREDWLRENGDA